MTGSSLIVVVQWKGRMVTVELVGIDDEGHELAADAAIAWRRMKLAADIDGVVLRALTAFRAREYQQLLRNKYELYAAYLKSVDNWVRGGRDGLEPERVQFAALAARPGNSEHEIGQAVDVLGAAHIGTPEDTWLRECSERHGWARTVASESWHYAFRPGLLSPGLVA